MMNGKYQMTEVELLPVLIIHDESDRERALKVLQKAEANCLISNSIKSSVTMNPVIKTEAVPV
jgi:organic hydroperoxide reductase OsmC/OhrA